MWFGVQILFSMGTTDIEYYSQAVYSGSSIYSQCNMEVHMVSGLLLDIVELCSSRSNSACSS